MGAEKVTCPRCMDHRIELDHISVRWFCNNCSRFSEVAPLPVAPSSMEPLRLSPVLLPGPRLLNPQQSQSPHHEEDWDLSDSEARSTIRQP